MLRIDNLDDISKFGIDVRAQILISGIFVESIKSLQGKVVNGFFTKCDSKFAPKLTFVT
jgi:hypothetical protein